MMAWIKRLLSEPDNETPCPVRWGATLAALVYHVAAGIGYASAALHFDIATLGQYLQHMVLLIGVGGSAVGVKSAMKGDAK